jgi:hypothetical protein
MRNALRGAPASCHDLCMTDILGGISNFFLRHRAHCVVHEIYHADCAACLRANDNGYVASWGVPDAEFSGNDGSALDSVSVDTSASDTPTADVPDTSDFGGFDGGNSGGGGASGDF